jgi:hypothetical protein
MFTTQKNPTADECKFEVQVVSHANDVDEIVKILEKNGNCSDHLPVTHFEVMTLTWNMLKKCRVLIDSDSRRVVSTNNGFNINEDIDSYKMRLKKNLSYVVNLVSSYNENPFCLPISVLCLQEITADALSLDEIDELLQVNHFTVKASDGYYLAQKCGSRKDELLMMAYDPRKITYVGSYPLSEIDGLAQMSEARFQAIKFLDQLTQIEFVILNLHQNWRMVNTVDDMKEEPAGVEDIYYILQYFQKMEIPCIITGDFNTKKIKLPKEAGKIVIGLNANMFWNLEKGQYQLDSCDHIIMNEMYVRKVLPILQQMIQVKHRKISNSLGVPSFFYSDSIELISSLGKVGDKNLFKL